MKKFKILVCGGRDYKDHKFVKTVLDSEVRERELDYKDVVLISGHARGADLLGETWAVLRDILVEIFPADWDTHGKAAGYIRNKRMLEEGKPDLVVAFPGGRGTANMEKIAREAGVEVISFN